MMWNGRNVLVTGAGGFIGAHLTQRLVEVGATVTALIHYDARPDRGNLELLPRAILDDVRVVSGDVRDPYLMMKVVEAQEVVFHLAALIPIPYSYQAPASYIETNVTGTLNVCEAARRADVTRLVHTSTSEVYGTAVTERIGEDHCQQAQSPYAASKIGADRVAESYARSFGLAVAIVRPFNTFGPGQSARAIIPTILGQLLAGADVLHLGALDPIRDFVFIDDTISGFLAVAESDACVGRATNIGTGVGVSIRQLANTAMEVVEHRVEIMTETRRLRPETSEVMRLVCHNQAAQVRCGWFPRISLRDGLERTAAFLRERTKSLRPMEYAL